VEVSALTAPQNRVDGVASGRGRGGHPIGRAGIGRLG